MKKNKLSEDQYYITQQHGTEPPFSGEYLNNKEKGIYKCVCCNSNLFSNLDSLNILQLNKLKRNYEAIGYSATEVKLQLNKIFSQT